MSEKENAKIEELELKVAQIYTAITGDGQMGLKGLVEVLNEHVAQSKKNNDALLSEFKEFKKLVVLDYVKDINRINERIDPIEKTHKETARNFGILGGVMLVFGYFISEIKEFFKLF